jgi:arylformamidase
VCDDIRVIGRIIDISRPLSAATAAWPGDRPFTLEWTATHARDSVAVSALTMSSHLGTHLDAPRHVDPRGPSVDQVPLDICIGPCQVVALPGHRGAVERAVLPPAWRPEAPWVLFASGSWPLGQAIPDTFAHLAPAFVDELADAGVVLVGVDTPSVDPADSTALPSHRRCAARGLLILEGLTLDRVTPGMYTLLALPLLVVGGEASPVRAALMAEGL